MSIFRKGGDESRTTMDKWMDTPDRIEAVGNRVVLHGSPGTGKTSKIIEWIVNVLKDNPNASVLYLVYNRRMMDEMRNRLWEAMHGEISDGKLEKTVLTMHSFFKRKLGIPSDRLANEVRSQWARKKGLTVKRKDKDSSGGNLRDVELDDSDRFFEMYDYSRAQSKKLSLKETPQYKGRTEGLQYDPDRMAASWESFKRRKGIYDFVDILRLAANGRKINYAEFQWQLVAIDEAQDLTPIMWKLADKLGSRAEYVCFAGDDKQAIYSFQGIDVGKFLKHMKGAKVLELQLSFRLPIEIWDEAKRIENEITMKFTTGFTHNGRHGKVLTLDTIENFLKTDGSRKWVLVWTNSQARAIGYELMKLGYIYKTINPNHSGYSPWDQEDMVTATNILQAYISGKMLSESDSSFLLEHILSGTEAAKGENSPEIGQLREMLRTKDIKKIRESFGSAFPGKFIDNSRFTDMQKRALKALKAGTLVTSENTIYMDTIHSVKGDENDLVAVVKRVPWQVDKGLKGSQEERDNVFRVFYVAVTRAKNVLVHLCVEDLKTDRNFEYLLEPGSNGTRGDQVQEERRGDA